MVKVQTTSGIYEIATPGGKLGARSMLIIGKLATVDGVMRVPEGDTEDVALIERIKASNERVMTAAMFDVFDRWASEVLPFIVKSGPHKYEDMPGEDQLAIFMAVSSQFKMADDFFQVVPEESNK